MKLTFKVKKNTATPALQAIRNGMTIQQLDMVVDRAAWISFRRVVLATPKKWFGNLRRSWIMRKPAPALRSIENPSKIMTFIEHGTANKGTGRIYPGPTKRALYIPLTRAAAMGWHSGLVMQKVDKTGMFIKGDYMLRSSVRGITPRLIVAKEAAKAKLTMLAEMKRHVRSVFNAAKAKG